LGGKNATWPSLFKLTLKHIFLCSRISDCLSDSLPKLLYGICFSQLALCLLYGSFGPLVLHVGLRASAFLLRRCLHCIGRCQNYLIVCLSAVTEGARTVFMFLLCHILLLFFLPVLVTAIRRTRRLVLVFCLLST
jgi:hypothetical protein